MRGYGHACTSSCGMTLIELGVNDIWLIVLQTQRRQIAEVSVGGGGGGVQRGISASGVVEAKLEPFEHEETGVG